MITVFKKSRDPLKQNYSPSMFSQCKIATRKKSNAFVPCEANDTTRGLLSLLEFGGFEFIDDSIIFMHTMIASSTLPRSRRCVATRWHDEFAHMRSNVKAFNA